MTLDSTQERNLRLTDYVMKTDQIRDQFIRLSSEDLEQEIRLNSTKDSILLSGCDQSATKESESSAVYFNMGFNNTASRVGFTVGKKNFAIGNYSIALGSSVSSIGDKSIATGYQTLAGNPSSKSSACQHSEGFQTSAINGYSHAEGYRVKAAGDYSHAEGCETRTLTSYAHTEGYQTSATGAYSHAEGWQTQTVGYNSHAEGAETKARGSGSHSEGHRTVAEGSHSHVQGWYNISKGDYSTVAGCNAASLCGIQYEITNISVVVGGVYKWTGTTYVSATQEEIDYGEEHGTIKNKECGSLNIYSNMAYNALNGYPDLTADDLYRITSGKNLFVITVPYEGVANKYSFVWSGRIRGDSQTDYATETGGKFYESHGDGSFNIKPNGGLCGFYIGEDNLCNIIDGAIQGHPTTDTSVSIETGDGYSTALSITKTQDSKQYIGLIKSQLTTDLGLGSYLTSVPKAEDNKIGGFQSNFATQGTERNYAVKMSGDNAYVNVPWTDTSVFIGKKTDKEELSDDYSEALEKKDDKLYLKISKLSTELKCVDEGFVNSSIASQTAHFRGTYNYVSSLYDLSSDVQTSAYLNINDYAYVISSENETNAANKIFDRYKITEINRDSETKIVTSLIWSYEYTLNNSSFTYKQWEAINSNATSAKIKEIDDKITKDQVGDYELSGSVYIPDVKLALKNGRLQKMKLTFENISEGSKEFYVFEA